MRPEGVWEFALEELDHYMSLNESSGIMPSVEALDRMVADKVEALLLFLQEHLDDLATVPLKAIGPLLDKLLDNSMIPLGHHTLVIRLQKIMARRVEDGEEAARPFLKKMEWTLKELARKGKRTRNPGKSRR
jgi:hypothetical protein